MTPRASSSASTASARLRELIAYLSARDWLFPLVAYAVWRGAQAITLASFGGAFSVHGRGPAGEPSLFLWDGAWYERILRHGYTPISGNQQPTHFFPLLSWVTWVVRLVVRSELAAALIVTTAASLAAVFLVYAVVREWKGQRVARFATALLLLFPTSFFLWQFYTESLFIALSAGALLAQRRGKLWLAGLLAAFVTMSRVPGIVFVGVLVVAHFMEGRKFNRQVAWYALGIAGIIPVILAQSIQAHDGLAFLSTGEAWARGVSLPWKPLNEAVRAYTRGEGPALSGWSWSTPNLKLGSPRDIIAGYLFLLLALVSLFRAWPWEARLLLFGMTLALLTTDSSAAMSRYVLAAWSGFAVIAELLERAPRWLMGIVALTCAVGTVAVLHDWGKGLFVA